MDLISLPIDIDNEKIDSNFRLVAASVMRAKDLAQGAHPVIATTSGKVTTIAIEEITSGALDILTGEAAAEAIEKAKKLAQKRAAEEAVEMEKLPEDLTELEKDLKVYLSEKGERDSKKVIEEIFGDSKNGD
ncbi:MAG: DNA-directed RNA polymerase subunit omega [Nitrospirae bacterium]|nr:DNA-directed RNA polymerase subunit omega [Nitrospirota bacterium]